MRDLFEGKMPVMEPSDLSIEQIAYAICRGGWPAAVSMGGEDALEMSRDYVEAIIHQDISRVDGVEKNPKRVQLLLRALARNVATMATNQTILNDVAANEMSISLPTVDGYMNALRRIFVIEDQAAWSPSMRSKSALRTSAKRHFIDPSIATAVLRTSPKGLLEDFNSFGFLFESLCTRDMRIYADANDGDVQHFRDRNGLEADMIVSLSDGRWAAVEVKLGNRQIEEAAEHLLQLSRKVDDEKMGKPSFLMVLTGGEYAYHRKDGVVVVPIGCLKD